MDIRHIWFRPQTKTSGGALLANALSSNSDTKDEQTAIQVSEFCTILTARRLQVRLNVVDSAAVCLCVSTDSRAAHHPKTSVNWRKVEQRHAGKRMI